MSKRMLTAVTAAMLCIPSVLAAQEMMDDGMMEKPMSEDCQPADKMKEGMTDDAMMEDDTMMEEDAMAEGGAMKDSMKDSMEDGSMKKDAMKKDCMAADNMEMKDAPMMEDKMDH